MVTSRKRTSAKDHLNFEPH